MNLFQTEKKHKKIGLALGSGGARGLSHLGVMRRLQELGIPIDCVAGTSIGSIMGAIFISGKVEETIHWAQELDWVKAAKLFAEVNVPITGFLRGKRIEELLRQFITFKDFSEMPIPFATVATNIVTGEEVVLRKGDLMEAIRASFAIPGVFMPIEHTDCQLVDGGLVNPLPISVCRAMGADVVIAVDINLRHGPVGYRSEKKTLKLFDILTNTIKIFENEVTRSTIAAQAPDVCIQPAVGDIFTLDFRTASTAIAAGYQAADEMRDVLRELLA